MKSEEDKRITEEIMRIYNRTYAEVRKRSFKLYEQAKVTVPQFSALHILKTHKRCTVTELARLLFLNQSTVSSLVDRLEKGGFVQREKGQDKRKSYLTLTKKGLSLTRSLPVQPLDIFRSLFAPLTKEEKKRFLELLKKIVAPFLTQIEEMDRQWSK